MIKKLWPFITLLPALPAYWQGHYKTAFWLEFTLLVLMCALCVLNELWHEARMHVAKKYGAGLIAAMDDDPVLRKSIYKAYDDHDQ